MIDLNPLNVLGIRKLNFLPVHFSIIKSQDLGIMHTFLDDVESWIVNKLSGRYCLVNTPLLNSNENLEDTAVIGFEEAKEMTYFLLSCPYIRRNK